MPKTVAAQHYAPTREGWRAVPASPAQLNRRDSPRAASAEATGRSRHRTGHSPSKFHGRPGTLEAIGTNSARAHHAGWLSRLVGARRQAERDGAGSDDPF